MQPSGRETKGRVGGLWVEDMYVFTGAATLEWNVLCRTGNRRRGLESRSVSCRFIYMQYGQCMYTLAGRLL